MRAPLRVPSRISLQASIEFYEKVPVKGSYEGSMVDRLHPNPEP